MPPPPATRVYARLCGGVAISGGKAHPVVSLLSASLFQLRHKHPTRTYRWDMPYNALPNEHGIGASQVLTPLYGVGEDGEDIC